MYVDGIQIRKKFQDLNNRIFGRWTVIRFMGYFDLGKGNIRACWLCKCECGKEEIKRSNSLLTGSTKSCGCLRDELSAERKLTHGGSKRPEYEVWLKMKSRCCREEDPDFHNYGGRGVKICSNYENNFEEFIKDIGNRPKFEGKRSKWSVDRADNNGHYSCGRCRECLENNWKMNIEWKTQKQQMRNVRYNRLIGFNGEIKCVAEWSEITGLSKGVIFYRIDKKEWVAKRIFLTAAKDKELTLWQKEQLQK